MSNNSRAEDDSFILFELAGTSYGIRSRDVRQLEMIEHVTPVPNASRAVEGVVFSRGQVIPAMNLRTRFGFPKIEYDLRTRLVVVNVEGRTIGLIVDAAREFKRIPAETIEPPPEGLDELKGQYLEGIATLDKRLIMILNLAEVVKTAEEIVSESES